MEEDENALLRQGGQPRSAERARLDISELSDKELHDREQLCYQVMRQHGRHVYQVQASPDKGGGGGHSLPVRELRDLYQYMLSRAEQLATYPNNDALLAEVSSLLIRARRRWEKIDPGDQRDLLQSSSSQFDLAMARTASEGRIYYPEDVLLMATDRSYPTALLRRKESAADTILVAADSDMAERAIARRWSPSSPSHDERVSIPTPEGRAAIASIQRRLHQILTIAHRATRNGAVARDALQQICYVTEDAMGDLRVLSDQRDVETVRGEEVVRRLAESEQDVRNVNRLGSDDTRRMELLVAKSREKDGVIDGLVERTREYEQVNEELRDAIKELRADNAKIRDALAAARASGSSSVMRTGIHISPEKVSEVGRTFQESRARVDRIINDYNASVADRRARESSHKMYEGVLDETGRIESTAFLDSNLSYIAPSALQESRPRPSSQFQRRQRDDGATIPASNYRQQDDGSSLFKINRPVQPSI